MWKSVSLSRKNRSDALDAYTPKLLSELTDCSSSFVTIFAFESALIGGVLLPFRQDAHGTLWARKVFGDGIFREHGTIPFFGRHSVF
jgi:hypothetical protein